MIVMTTKGICNVCNSEITKASAIRHLYKCTAGEISAPANSIGSSFYIRIESEGKYYWIDVCADRSLELKDLDQFLRDTWLECCGHLSMFEINCKRYETEVEDDIYDREVENMDVELDKVFKEDTIAYYEYDFGSTTSLTIRVLATISVKYPESKIELLVRNVNPYKDTTNSPRAGVCGYPS